MLSTSSLLKGETGDYSFHADDLHMGTGQQEKSESRECYSNFKRMRVEVIRCFLSMAGAPRNLQQHFESLIFITFPPCVLRHVEISSFKPL